MLRAQMGMQEFGIQQQGVRQQNAIEGDRVLQESRIQGQLMLQQQELSQAEHLRLQRMKAARAEVASADWLTKKQKRAYDLELATGINEYEQRIAASTVRMKDMQTKELQEQMAQAQTRRHMNDAFLAGNFEKLPLITDPVTGKQFRMLQDSQGKFYDPFEKSRPKPGGDLDPIKLDEYATKKSFELVPRRKNPETGVEEDPLSPAERTKLIDEEKIRRQMDYQRQQGDGYGQPAAGGGGQSQSAGGGAAEQKPFDINDVSKATPEQRLVINTIGDTKRLVVESNLPPEAKEMYQEQAAVAEMLLAQHGSVQGMDETKAKLFARIVQSLGQVQRQLTGPRPAPNPPASPPLPPKIANPPVHFTS